MPRWVTVVHAASRALGVLAAGLILLSVLVVCQMVFVRAVLGQSSIWQTEFVIYSLVAATFLGAPYILLTRGHVGVDLVPLLLPPRRRRQMHLVGSTVGILFIGMFLYGALPWWYDAWTQDIRSPSIWHPRLWIPYLTVPVGLAVLLLQYASEIYLVWTDRDHPFGLKPEDRL
jgi:TRAP-type C4-dicarboxylate transport system permease small subunit